MTWARRPTPTRPRSKNCTRLKQEYEQALGQVRTKLEAALISARQMHRLRSNRQIAPEPMACRCKPTRVDDEKALQSAERARALNVDSTLASKRRPEARAPKARWRIVPPSSRRQPRQGPGQGRHASGHHRHRLHRRDTGVVRQAGGTALRGRQRHADHGDDARLDRALHSELRPRGDRHHAGRHQQARRPQSRGSVRRSPPARSYRGSRRPATVTGVSPDKRPGQGRHARSVITGTGFTGATEVSFDKLAAPRFAVDSDTQITATTPDSTRHFTPSCDLEVDRHHARPARTAARRPQSRG